jgi:pimeloyl-ACP methyl ester carboxylesterase
MQPLFEHRLELAGYGTRALELEGEGDPLLLLHGYADSADTWRRTLDRLGRADRRAIAIDLPGFGSADRLRRDAGVVEQLEAFAADAVRHLHAEHGRPVHVAGNSLGGLTALRLAMRDDLPLAGVVPVAPAGFDHPRWFSVIDTQPVIRFLLAAPVPLPEPLLRSMVGGVFRQLAFARPRAMSGDVVDAFTAHHRTQRDVRRYLATGRTLRPEIDGGRAVELDRIGVPVTLVWGDRDRMVPHTGSRHLVEALPGMRYELLEGIGHCPQIEAPDRFVEILLEATTPLAAAA